MKLRMLKQIRDRRNRYLRMGRKHIYWAKALPWNTRKRPVRHHSAQLER